MRQNITKLNDRRTVKINEKTMLLQNLEQILTEVVRQHGAKSTLDGIKGMIQVAAKQVRAERDVKPQVNEAYPNDYYYKGVSK